MVKVIALFNHKGGVSKTTTTFHLGWMMALFGKKVLMVDADPQCNLTSLALNIEDNDSLVAYYDSKKNTDIYASLAGVFGLADGVVNLDGGVATQAIRERLHILPGHVKFGFFEPIIATALTTSDNLPTLKPLIGAINKLIRKTGERGQFDYVLVDMSPSISSTNMSLIMSSDYFLIPTSPDFYCYQSIDSLSEVFLTWVTKMKPFKNGIILPAKNPKLLGIISQNYRSYGGNMTKAFEQWATKIKKTTKEVLVPPLTAVDMVISEEAFKRCVRADSPYNLAKIQDFNSLIPTSQRLSKPIFSLQQEDGNGKWQGATWERKQNRKNVGIKYNIEEAKKVYKDLAIAVCNLTECPPSSQEIDEGLHQLGLSHV